VSATLDTLAGLAPRRVLDFGCGGVGSHLDLPGYPALAAVYPRAEIVGYEPGLAPAQRPPGYSRCHAGPLPLPEPDGHFDLVAAIDVLEHVRDLDRGLAELRRLLAPGGHLVVEVYNPHSLRALVKRLGGPRRILAGIDEGEVATRYDSLGALRAAAPPELELRQLRGVRIFTPAARLHDLPLVGPLLGWAEARLAETSLRRIAGFLIATFRKVG